MAAAETTTAGTQAPSPERGGFPPFKSETYPAQLFWLTVTFAFLFVVLWRVAGPRIAGVIGERKGRIAGDIGSAERHRKDAEAALASYQSALAAGRDSARALLEENRKRIAAEADRVKAIADAQAREASGAAEARIAAVRAESRDKLSKAAAEVAVAIVARLIGESVPPDEAAAAVRSAAGS
jgi:F-type H+-transporting ATPase subunit b